MKLTLVEIIEAIEAGTIGTLDLTVEEEVLAGSFVHERTERPEMLRIVVEHEVLLVRYLALPADHRALLEGLRAKRPEYLEGDYNSEPAAPLNTKPGSFTEPTWQLYKDTHTTKAITHIITHYTQNPPTNTHGKPVSPTAYFQTYDPHTAKNLTPRKDGKKTTQPTAPGNKYYAQWRTQHYKDNTTPDFDTWIQQQLPPELQTKLQQTPYYQQEKPQDLTINQIVEHYTNNPPTSREGPVSLNAYFQSYDPHTNTNLKLIKDGKRQTTPTPPGKKYYQQWRKLQNKNSNTPDFDTWIHDQLPPELKSQLLQTPYYQRKSSGGDSS